MANSLWHRLRTLVSNSRQNEQIQQHSYRLHLRGYGSAEFTSDTWTPVYEDQEFIVFSCRDDGNNRRRDVRSRSAMSARVPGLGVRRVPPRRHGPHDARRVLLPPDLQQHRRRVLASSCR